jgi:hypothetical protein
MKLRRKKIFATFRFYFLLACILGSFSISAQVTGVEKEATYWKDDQQIDSTHHRYGKKHEFRQPGILEEKDRIATGITEPFTYQNQWNNPQKDSMKASRGTQPTVMAPSNDNCTSATSLGTVNTTTTVAGTNVGATADVGPPTCFDALGATNVWYTFTSTGGSYSFVVAGGTIVHPDVAVWQYGTACSYGTAVEYGCNYYTTASTVTLTISCLPAGTYYIFVDDDYYSCGPCTGTQGTFNLTVTKNSSAPTNDLCANATNLTFNSSSSSGLTVAYTATVTSNNTCAGSDQSSTVCYTNNSNVWYKFTPPVNGSYFISVTGGTIVYPELAVLSGSCGAFTTIDCAGNSQYSSVSGPYQPYSYFGGTTFTHYSYVGACNLTTGNTYYIMVDNYPTGSNGTFTLTVATLSNDDPSNAGIIANCGVAFAGSTIGATNCNNGSGDGVYNNLDGNTGTTCSGSSGASGGATCCGGSCLGTAGSGANSSVCISGGDVGYSVENDSWYQFCITSASTFTVTFAPNAASCVPASDGLQIAIFKGTASSMTKLDGGFCGQDLTSSTSFNLSGSANDCFFIEVDGFAGTNCDYNLTVNFSPSCALPLNILQFKASMAETNKVRLDWTVAQEEDMDHYTIMKSTDGTTFSELAHSSAVGKSRTALNYTVYDKEPSPGMNYYKLFGYDKLGQGSVLAHTFITNNAALAKMKVFPNPANTELHIEMSNVSSDQVEISVYDSYENTVWTSSLQPDSNGNIQQAIDLSALPPGLYSIHASTGFSSYTRKVIISR